jgi:hypothetical protein
MYGGAMKRLFWICAAAILAVLTGCASVPMEPIERDTSAKTFSVTPGKSAIYLYRNETFGAAIPMTVSLDGKVAGQTGPKTYFLFEVAPGSHELSSMGENVSTLKINTLAGKAHYVWQEIKMGMFGARSQLQEVDEQTGRAGVGESKRAQAQF